MTDNRTIYNCFSTPDGVKVLEWMEIQISGNTVRKDKNGRVDEYATVGAARIADFVNLIKQRIEDGKLAR